MRVEDSGRGRAAGQGSAGAVPPEAEGPGIPAPGPAEAGRGSGWWLLAGGVAALAALAWMAGRERGAAPPAAVPTVERAAVAATPAPGVAVPSPLAATPAPGAAAPAPPPIAPAEAESAAGLPAFDLVRAEADGTVLVAGRGRPGARVIVLVDGAEAMPVRVDAAGQFAAFLRLDGAGRPRVLRLRMEGEGGEILGRDEVMVALAAPPAAQGAGGAAPTEGRGAGTAVAPGAPPDGGAPPAGGEAAIATPAGGNVAVDAGPVAAIATPAAAGPPPAEPAGAAVIAATASDAQTMGAPTQTVRLADAPPPGGGDGTGSDAAALPASQDPPPGPAGAAPAPSGAEEARVAVLALGPEGPRVPGRVRGLTLDSLAYEAGGLRFGGRSDSDGTVRLYVNDRFMGDAAVDAAGGWHLATAALEGGLHTARVDRVDAGGRVSARVELPFAADPGALAASVEGPVAVTIVQPGESLWRIAARRYGSGLLYVRLFEANRAQIRDPDLIYPGQVFALPEN